MQQNAEEASWMSWDLQEMQWVNWGLQEAERRPLEDIRKELMFLVDYLPTSQIRAYVYGIRRSCEKKLKRIPTFVELGLCRQQFVSAPSPLLVAS